MLQRGTQKCGIVKLIPNPLLAIFQIGLESRIFFGQWRTQLKKLDANYRLIGPACELSSKIGDNRQDGGKLPEEIQLVRGKQSLVHTIRLARIVKYVNSSNLGRM